MKKLIFSLTMTTVVLAGAVAASAPTSTTLEVEKTIDLRLHRMLVKLNAEKK